MFVPLAVASLYVVLPVATIAYWFIWSVYSRFFHPLSRYPGPFLASISRAWLVSQGAGARAEETQRELHAKYGNEDCTMQSRILLLIGQGSIVRIAPNEVAIADPTAIKTIYSISSAFTKVCGIYSLGQEQRGLKVSATKTTF